MGQISRRPEIRRKRARKAKLHDMRERYMAAKTKKEKDEILAKLGVVAPWLTADQFLTPVAAPVKK